MKYLIIGAGGTGGSLCAFMSENGLDVTLIARGAHLEAIKTHGLRMQTTAKGDYTLFPIKATTMEEYHDQPDVIFVCVKGYSLDACVPFIERIAHKDTIVIPILNIYGTGGKLQEKLPHLLVTDGCIYIAAEIKEAGCIAIAGDIFRVVFGVRHENEYRTILKTIEDDLNQSCIRGILSNNIKRDALQKFSFVSPMAACGAYFDVNAHAMQKEGNERAMFQALIEEVLLLAKAMCIDLTNDTVTKNIAILDALLPTASTSMQRDLKKGGESEMDGLIFEVVRLAKKHGLNLPNYEKVAEKFGFLAV